MDIISSMSNVINTITNNTYVGKLIVGGTALTTAFFTPIVGLLFACFSLNVADLISGLSVAHKQGKKLTSRKTWKGTITKVLLESLLIVLLHIIEHFAFSAVGVDQITMLSGGATILMCVTELWSVLENLNTINPDGPWRILSKWLRKKGGDIAGINITVTKDGKLDVETGVINDIDELA